MKEKSKKFDIGVIVGRFQIHNLHLGHREIFDEVISRHNKVIVFLGCSSAIGAPENAMDFTTRKIMVEELYGDKISSILPLYDKKLDEVWSKIIDNKIREVFPIGSVVLYGSRDSFISRYFGKFDTIELEASNQISASEVRKDVSNRVGKTEDFRAGIIYNAYNAYPKVYPTIDVAIMNENYSQLLLGRRKEENEFRFVGGFVDTTDEDLEATVRREAKEETDLEVGDIKYICSTLVNDWRYPKGSSQVIMTHFHVAKKIFGKEQPCDDMDGEVRWFDINSINEEIMVTEHKRLLIKLKKHLNI